VQGIFADADLLPFIKKNSAESFHKLPAPDSVICFLSQ
jgi:hypothetical protein